MKKYLNTSLKSFYKQLVMSKIYHKINKIILNFNNKEIKIKFQEICTNKCQLMAIKTLKITRGMTEWK